MVTIKEHFISIGLDDMRKKKTDAHKEKISRGNKENWKKRRVIYGTKI